MVQGDTKVNTKREKKEAPKRKSAPKDKGEKGRDEVSKTIFRKVKHHQKKIYKSIEQTIIDQAKKGRERFDII
jgi:hypothetical protein